MSNDDEPAARVADPRVAQALERMAAAAGVDLDATPEVFEGVYRQLQGALSEPEQQS